MHADESSAPLVSLAAPAYNEAAGIAATIDEWGQSMDRAGIDAEFVICNDGSTDGTAELLAQVQKRERRLRIVGGPENHGYGHALATAIAACRGRYIATIDSDGQFDPAAVAEFVRAAEADKADGCVGYRVKKQDSILRVVADRALNLIVRVMFQTRLRDTNCALKVIRRELLQSIRLESTGFPFPTEVCLKLEASGARLIELPVQHRPRPAGESKLRVWWTGWRMLRFLLYLRCRLRLWRARILREL